MILSKKWFSNFRGLTIVELLIAGSLIAAVGAIMVMIFVQNSGVLLKQQAKVSQGLNANDAHAEITEVIRQASAVATSYSSYTSNGTTLVLKLASYNGQGTLINDTYDYAVFKRDATNSAILRKQIFPNASSSRSAESEVLAKDVSNLTFIYYDNNKSVVTPANATIIDFTINLTTAAGKDQATASSSGQVHLRNN